MRGRRPTATRTVSNPISVPSASTADHAAPSRRTAVDRGAGAHLDTVGDERPGDELRGVGVFPGEQAFGGLDDRDLGPEAGEGLAELAADAAAAEHQQPAGQSVSARNGLVRQRGRVGQPGNRGHHRGGAGGDQRLPERHRHAVDRGRRSGPVNRAEPCAAETPAARIAAGESVGSIVAMACRTWAITAGSRP